MKMRTQTKKISKPPKKPEKRTWANIPPEEAARLREALLKRFGPPLAGEILDWRAAMK